MSAESVATVLGPFVERLFEAPVRERVHRD